MQQLHQEEEPQAAWLERILETGHRVLPTGKPRVREAWRGGGAPGSHHTNSTTGVGRKSMVSAKRMARETRVLFLDAG